MTDWSDLATTKLQQKYKKQIQISTKIQKQSQRLLLEALRFKQATWKGSGIEIERAIGRQIFLRAAMEVSENSYFLYCWRDIRIKGE